MSENFAIPCAGAIIYKMIDNKVFIVTQTRRKTTDNAGNGLIEIPAGKIREYENINDTIRREVLEETGLFVKDILNPKESHYVDVTLDFETNTFYPFCITQNMSGGYSIILFTFICTSDGNLLSETNESYNIQWTNLDDIDHMLKNNREEIFPMHINGLNMFLEFKKNNFLLLKNFYENSKFKK